MSALVPPRRWDFLSPARGMFCRCAGEEMETASVEEGGAMDVQRFEATSLREMMGNKFTFLER